MCTVRRKLLGLVKPYERYKDERYWPIFWRTRYSITSVIIMIFVNVIVMYFDFTDDVGSVHRNVDNFERWR